MSKPNISDYTVPVQPVANLVNQLYATAQANNDKEDPVENAIRTLSMEIGIQLTAMIPKEAIRLLEGYDNDLENGWSDSV